MSFENLFFNFFSKTHFKHVIPIWACVWKNLLSPVSKQKQAQIGCFSLNIRLNVPLNLIEDTPVLALKIS